MELLPIGKRLLQKFLDQCGRHLFGNEGLADSARQDKAQPSVDHLLVLPHQGQQRGRIRQAARDVAQARLHPHRHQMRPHPARILLRAQAQPLAQIKRQTAADGHALASMPSCGRCR